MNKEQYAGRLKEIADTHKQGGDVSACIAKYNEQLSKFTEEFLVSEAMKMSDREYEPMQFQFCRIWGFRRNRLPKPRRGSLH